MKVHHLATLGRSIFMSSPRRDAEQVAVICRNDEVLHAGIGKPQHRLSDVLQHGAHDPPRHSLREALAGAVDLLRAHHDNRGPP